MPLRWKVCGVTRIEDGLEAVVAGADAVGFVFVPGWPDAVSIDAASRISEVLPASTWRFGVFADERPDTMAAIVDRVGLDFLQLSGHEPGVRCVGLVRHAFKVLRPLPSADAATIVRQAGEYPDCTLLVRVPRATVARGPDGLAAVAELAGRHRLMLGGGWIGADSLREAVEAVRPWAVDVTAGLESAPGVKDHGKLRAFGRALRPYR